MKTELLNGLSGVQPWPILCFFLFLTEMQLVLFKAEPTFCKSDDDAQLLQLTPLQSSMSSETPGMLNGRADANQKQRKQCKDPH